MSSSLTILGIDPGYDRIGWSFATIQGAKIELLAYGCIETNRKASLTARYQDIQQQLALLIKKYLPQEAAIETLFFSKNQKTAMQVSEARGVILATLLNQQIACFDYNPMQIKQAVTGSGNADKAAVERMIRLQFPLPASKILDDTMDAIAVTLTHAVSRKLKKLL